MKFQALFALAFALTVSAQANKKGNNNKGNNNKGGANNQNQNGGNKGGNGQDAQSSLTLDPKVIAKGFANDGQQPPVAGQVASLTSTNNFINFCLTRPDLPLTNGKQTKTGSCNPAPMGIIPSTQNMPSCKFVFPKNGDKITENTAFTVKMAIKNLNTGFFVNAQENYFAGPQRTTNGVINGHSHVVIEKLSSITQTTPTDPNVFAFFKGLNAAATNGQLTADVEKGLPAGVYKITSINSSENHQPVLVPIAQHGSTEDCTYFEVVKKGAATGNANDGKGGKAGNGAAAAAPVASGKPAAAPKPAKGANNAQKGNNNKGNNKNGQGKRNGGRLNKRFASRLQF
jgi:hypothetical protein